MVGKISLAHVGQQPDDDGMGGSGKKPFNYKQSDSLCESRLGRLLVFGEQKTSKIPLFVYIVEYKCIRSGIEMELSHSLFAVWLIFPANSI
jgi:hypothetical protein